MYLPIELLEEDNDNVFTSLSKEAFSLLEESIIINGIELPFIVVPKGNSKKYIVKDGNDRLKIVHKHSISPVRCIVKNAVDIGE